MKKQLPKTISPNSSGWCPGCGHGIVARLIAEAVEELGVSDKLIIITDVACGQFISTAFTFNNIGAAHGRPIITAAGAKRARKDALVLAHIGDGAAYSIGIESTIHAALRNENIVAIVVNNGVFGMTGGQMSPASLLGQKTTSSPAGRSIEKNGSPLDIVKTIGQYDIAYLARGSVDSPNEITKAGRYIQKAFKKQLNGEGFCLVEILSPCPTNWNLSPLDSLKRMREEQKVFYPVGEFVDKGGRA